MIGQFIKRIKIHISTDKEFYHSIKNIFGFYPGNIFLYKLALRHRSVAKEITEGVKISNERLEYLGDAILGAIVADYLFKKYPIKDEGFLTDMRSKIVSRASLNKLSQKLGIDKLIQVDKDNNKHFRSINGDAFEAMVGALFLDKGYDFTHHIMINRVIAVHFDLEELVKAEMNHKSTLLEYCQKKKMELEYNVIQEIGTGYRKQFEVEAIINGKSMSKARDYSIKGAEKLAAEKAYTKLNPAKSNPEH
ncbi:MULTISPECIES: ribonuclease III [unclassified Lentimicrobium]|uniref:ribonuclease III n=1 Tax=unclassified Lentimicrobium TaxID=2677434 RepID=UPI00210F9FE7|nr:MULTISPECIES: ribonuclease III [unclassified Lentimicrobium]